MASLAGARLVPMKTAGTEHLIERTYREGGTFQWVRETYVNAEDAGATRVEYGVEWQAVENHGVYRRLIADNGCGMTGDELVAFFNTFGGGGKPIGGVHENFGVGAKTSLLPWNHYGMVVISWVDGEPAMIWVEKDMQTGQYGLRVEEVEDDETDDVSLEAVYAPYEDEEHGVDWDAVKPDWLDESGTVIVLLGNSPSDDTVLGDPTRAETDIKGVSAYLNRRLWEIPDAMEVYVDELRTQDRAQWPRSADEAHGPEPRSGPDRRTNLRKIRGASFYIRYPSKSFKAGRLAASGKLALDDGTGIDWYLWHGDRPAVQSYAARGGYIGAMYRNELYDITAHHATYRSFGISEMSIRTRLWLIARPQELDHGGKVGVYPRGDRNSLLLRGGPNAGGPLPINEWGNEFAEKMPDEIKDAIRAVRADQDGTISDPRWRERLAERFGARWRIPRLRLRRGGNLTVDPIQPGGSPLRKKVRKRRRSGNGGQSGGRGGALTTGMHPGSGKASRVKTAGGIPSYRTVRGEELGAGMLAAWQARDPDYPEGVVLLNVDHPVLEEEINHWQSQYPDHLAEEIRDEVIDCYGQIAVAKVAHSEHLKGIVPAQIVEEKFRSDEALTMALLGLIGEEAVIAPRIGGKFKRRSAA